MGSMALQLKPFTVADPIETYGRAMSLRALMDERRYRALREQQAQQKILEDQEERQQAVNLRQLFSTNPNPTTAEVMAAAPGPLGFRYMTEQRQAQTAAEAQKTAELTRQKTQNELDKFKRQLAVNKAAAILREPDPERRAAAWARHTPELVDLGMLPPDELARGYDDNTFTRLFIESEGEEAYNKLIESRKEAERKEAGELRAQAEEERKVAGEARAVAKEERAVAEAGRPTGTLREFKESYYPGWLAEKGLQPSAVNEKNALVDWREHLRARIGGVPGVDVPKSPEVIQSEIDAAARRAKAVAEATAGTKPGNLAAFKTKSLALKNLEDAISAYKTELEKVGPTFLPEKGARLKSLFTDLQMKTKSLFELGVITGPDMQILQGAITDPTGVRGNLLGTSALLEQLGVLKSTAERSRNNLKEVYGQGGETTGATPPSGVPKVGDTFNGEKVKKVTKVQ